MPARIRIDRNVRSARTRRSCLRVVMKFDAQAAKRDTEKAGSVRTIAVAANEGSENVPPLDLGNGEPASIWVHGSGFCSI